MAPLTPLTRNGALAIDSRKRSRSLSPKPSPLSPLGNDSRRQCQSVGGSPLSSPVAEDDSWECISEAASHCDAELSEGVPPGPPSRPPSLPSPMHEPLLAVDNGVASGYYVGVAGEFHQESQWNAPLPCLPAVWGMPLAASWESMPPSMLPMPQPQEYTVPMGLPMATLPSQPVQKVEQGIAMNTPCKFAPGFFDLTVQEAAAELIEAVPSAKPYFIDPKAKKEAKKCKKNKNKNRCK